MANEDLEGKTEEKIKGKRIRVSLPQFIAFSVNANEGDILEIPGRNPELVIEGQAYYIKPYGRSEFTTIRPINITGFSVKKYWSIEDYGAIFEVHDEKKVYYDDNTTKFSEYAHRWEEAGL